MNVQVRICAAAGRGQPCHKRSETLPEQLVSCQYPPGRSFQDIQIEVNANTEGEFVLRDVSNEYYVLAKNAKYVWTLTHMPRR